MILTMVVRIYGDGRVKYTTLLNYDVNCPMNFVFYPFDTQAPMLIDNISFDIYL